MTSDGSLAEPAHARRRARAALIGGFLALSAAVLVRSPQARAAGPTAADLPPSAASQAAASELIRAWDHAVQGKDLPALVALYDSSDPLLLARIEQTARGWTALDTLECASRIASIRASAETLNAVVFRRMTYRARGRAQCLLGWNTMRLVGTAGGWKIASDEDRTPARARWTDLRVKLFPESGRMEGDALLRLDVAEPGEDNVLLGLNRGLEVTAVAGGDGRPLPIERIADAVVVPLPASLRPGGSQVLAIRFEGFLFNESREDGYSQVSIAPEGCFASWVTNWYPHLLGTASESAGRIVFDVPAGESVAASGRPAGRTVHGDREEHAFDVRRPVDFSFGVGRYFHREQEVDGVAVGVYLLRGGEEKASFYLPSLARILRFERDLYGFYPFDSYSIVEIPAGPAGTLGGSSEQGMNLFPVGGLPDDWIPLSLLAHEMGHSWWGNLVHGEGGSIIDEGLAQTTAALCVGEIEGDASMRRFLQWGRPEYPQGAMMYFQIHAGRQDRDPPLASAAVPGNRMLLHELADTKGHFVYDMLRQTIGTDAFVRGLRSAASRFAFKQIRLSDLQDAWEAASGRDLSVFFGQWFHRSGAPDFALRYEIMSDGRRTEVRGVLSQAGEPYAARVEIAPLWRGAAPDGAAPHLVDITGQEASFTFQVPAKPDTVVVDPQYKLLRWTDEFRGLGALTAARRLRSAGDADSAVALLTKTGAAETPAGIAGMDELGLCYRDLGDLARAESCFRRAHDRALLSRTDSPAAVLSTLHLGQLCDLAGRREEALRAYAEVLAGPDAASAHDEARAGLASPYVVKPRASGPGRAALAALSGTYAGESGVTVRIAIGADSLLTAELPGKPPMPLAWSDGLAFRSLVVEGINFSFGGGAPCPALDVDVKGRLFHLERKEQK